jgi:ribonuclease III
MLERSLERVSEALGYRFAEATLGERALSHRSAVADSKAVSDNEQLEYLGDAVLGMLVSEYLVRTFPQWSEGQLSKSRAHLVNSASLCAAARRLGLGEYLLLGRGEEKTGGREKPALLADAFEAVLGAIYLDGGLEAARSFVHRALLQAAIQGEGQGLEMSDNKSALQELLQARGLPPARYHVVRETGPEHRKTFWIEVAVEGLLTANGSGSNKKEAEQSAAERALEKLGSHIGATGK